MERKIIFVHQPKTGGANFAQILKNSYGRKMVYRDKDRAKERLNQYLISQGETVEQHEDEFYDRLNYKVIYGHFSPLKYKKRFPNAFYMTFFRDPIQRIVSHYHYWKRTSIHDLRSVNPLRIKFIEENLTLRDFGIMITEDRRKENHLENFNAKNFHFVGIMEEYTKSLQLLKQKYLPNLIYFDEGNFNANPDKSPKEKYDVADQDFFENLLKEEVEQYNIALSKFQHEYSKSRIK